MAATSSFAQTETIIWNFPANTYPAAGLHLVKRTGTLYGTTQQGGGVNGTVFSLRERHEEWRSKTLYAFDGGTDGSAPDAGVIEDAAGNLYGTTSGGTSGGGTVFELRRLGSSWIETVLHDFSGGSDGVGPGNLIMDRTTGAIFGTTAQGGAADCGTAFELSQSKGTWTETVIYAFQGGRDGCSPQGLREDSKGRLYGVTNLGGNHARGSVFVLANAKGVWHESPIYDFSGTSEGSYPTDLDLDPNTGTLYGTTETGGSSNKGVVFQLTHTGTEWTQTTLHDFAGKPDGSDPLRIHFDPASGRLFGTTYAGGLSDSGSVFQFVGAGSSWTYSQLYGFGAPGDGINPVSRPTVDPDTGYLYGTTTQGGAYSGGTAWMIVP